MAPMKFILGKEIHNATRTSEWHILCESLNLSDVAENNSQPAVFILVGQSMSMSSTL